MHPTHHSQRISPAGQQWAGDAGREASKWAVRAMVLTIRGDQVIFGQLKHLCSAVPSGSQSFGPLNGRSPMSASLQFQRYHALDALRATMMLLGLVLHSAVSYTARPLGAAWPYHDQQTSPWFELVVFFIHLFRMPEFFVVAGFFGALLFYRDGASGMARNRLTRVLVPLALAWVVLYPLTAAGFVFAWGQGAAADAPGWEYITSGVFLTQMNLIHLWFLYDLLIFYTAALVALPLLQWAPKGLCRGIEATFRRLVTSAWGPIGCSAVTALTLLPMSTAGLDTSTSFTPPLRILIAYGVFFAFGWLLYTHRDLMNAFGRRFRWHLLAGAVCSGLYLFTVLRPLFADAAYNHLAGIGTASVAIWLLIFGITGLFVRHVERPSPLVRYLADASYWMYLVHLPLTIWIPGLLASVALPGAVKFSIVLSVTVCITLLTYYAFVRSTAVGTLLNGRRYPRGLPRSEISPLPSQIAASQVTQADPLSRTASSTMSHVWRRPI
jgi:glucan biosynthesis protein C